MKKQIFAIALVGIFAAQAGLSLSAHAANSGYSSADQKNQQKRQELIDRRKAKDPNYVAPQSTRDPKAAAGDNRADAANDAKREALIQQKMKNPNYNASRDANNKGYERADLQNQQKRANLQGEKIDNRQERLGKGPSEGYKSADLQNQENRNNLQKEKINNKLDRLNDNK